MFAKLLKHEWRSSREVLGLLCGIILISGATIGGVALYLLRMGAANGSLMTMSVTMLLFAAMLAIGICCAGGMFYLIWRYYQSRFTEEGYLTFTLPVNYHQLLLSSLLNSIWGCILLALAALGAVILAGGILLIAFSGEIPWSDAVAAMRRVWPDIASSFQKNWREFAALFAGGLVSLVSNLVTLMLAVTIGAMIARRHKLLATVGVLFGINMAEGAFFLPQLVRIFEMESAMDLLQYPCVTGMITIVLGYFLMYWLTSRKLNLT